MRVENSRMIYRGANELARVYRGDHVIVWEPHKYDEMYLTLEVVNTDSVGSFYFESASGVSPALDIEFSMDGGNTWIQYSSSTSVQREMRVGDKVMVRGNNATYSHYSEQMEDYDCGSRLGILNSDFSVYGNAMSLIFGDNFIGQTTLTSANDSCFLSLFMPVGSGMCVEAKDLILPATTLSDSCYMGMFHNTAVKIAPALPARNIAYSCYHSMFLNSDLEVAPALPATTLAVECYSAMFAGTNITRAPDLNASTLVFSCYWMMFAGCKNLNYIKCLAEHNVFPSCTGDWVDGVASAGTFINATEMAGWEIGDNGIPSGWTGYTKQAIQEYTTLDIISGGTLSMNERYFINGGWSSYWGTHLFYSVNGGQWLDGTAMNTLSVSAGDQVRIKGNFSDRTTLYYAPSFSGSTCYFNVFGNARSLTDSDNYLSSTGNHEYGFPYLFMKTNVVSAKNFMLPDGHYMSNEFRGTFYGCSNLTEAPIIRGSYADEYSMVEMFAGGCSNLNKIVSYLTYVESTATIRWLQQVSQNGTFYKLLDTTYQTGENGIPSGWLVYIL